MSVDTYLEGSRLEVPATFLNAAGELADPTTVTYVVMRDGIVVATLVWPGSPAITHPSLGLFVLQYDVDVAGEYKFHVKSTGAIKAPGERMVKVIKGHVPA